MDQDIPSLTCKVGERLTLVFHNALLTAQEAFKVEKGLSRLGLVRVIDEDHFEFGADLTGCAPALFASRFTHFVKVGLKHSRFKKDGR